MKLYETYFTSGEHEMEYAVFVSATGTSLDARAYLLNEDLVAEDIPLVIHSVNELTTAYASNGDPYKIGLTGEAV